MIINGNCLDVLKAMDTNSVDSIVTDPPYEIGFMNKKWDNTGIAYKKELWQECLRVLKPGGHLLAFGGSRTYHRMACAIENAGFEIRDMIEWVYGSGFPKSNNISKSIDKMKGCERKVVRKNPHYCKGRTNQTINAVGTTGSLKAQPEFLTAPSSPDAKQWDGFGTGLKPAHEPICMARKPITEKTIAKNVLKYGTGGINVDKCRIKLSNQDDPTIKLKANKSSTFSANATNWDTTNLKSQGRFPANLILDGSEVVKKLFPNSKTGSIKPHKNAGSWKCSSANITGSHNGDSGSASRYFKCCTSSEKEKVAEDCFFMYNIRKQEDICGYILEKTKVDIITIGVMKEVENFTNVVVQLLLGKASMENFKMDIASIILTLTKLMTELKTLDVLQKKNINIYMEGKGKITKLLKELNIESVKDAKNINQLMNFKNEVLELIKDIVSRVSVKPYRNGEQKIKNIITPIIENTEKNTRFFYAAKTSKHERNLGCEELETKLVLNPGDVCAGKNLKTAPNGKPNKPIYSKNYHPTVKPIALMSYLINLVTPPKGIILDPFMGSGSTGVAATKEGFEFIGIELNKEYYEIANKRIEYAIKNKENIFTV